MWNAEKFDLFHMFLFLNVVSANYVFHFHMTLFKRLGLLKGTLSSGFNDTFIRLSELLGTTICC